MKNYEDTELAKLVKKLQALPPVNQQEEQEPQEYQSLDIDTPIANKLAVFRHEGHVVLEPRRDDVTFVSVIMSPAEALALAQAALEVETAVREERPVDQKYQDGFLMLINDVEQEQVDE